MPDIRYKKIGIIKLSGFLQFAKLSSMPHFHLIQFIPRLYKYKQLTRNDATACTVGSSGNWTAAIPVTSTIHHNVIITTQTQGKRKHLKNKK